MRRVAGTTLLLLLLDAASAQSFSAIGKYLAPSGMFASEANVRMTPDGTQIFWVETGAYAQCGALLGHIRISTIRPDGTGYRVVVSEMQLLSLMPRGQSTQPDDLRISPDGKWLWFGWNHYHSSSGCQPVAPYHWYRVEVDTSEVTEFLHDGYAPAYLSYSDDGSRLVFAGYDGETDAWWYFLADPDGSNPQKVLDTSPWYTTPGMITPDGTKLLFAGWTLVPGYSAHVYLYDLAARELTQVSPIPGDYLYGLS